MTQLSPHKAADEHTVYPVGRGVSGTDMLANPLIQNIMTPGVLLYRGFSAGLKWMGRRRMGGRWDDLTVVSIGNIEVGGTGKSPLAIHLIHLLTDSGRRPVFVSRGFKSRSDRFDSLTVIVPSGATIPPQFLPGVRYVPNRGDTLVDAIGDEASMIAARCPDTPLVLSRNKNSAIKLARCVFEPTHVILDDAFQSWSVPRDLDIVLLDARSPWGNGRTLPAGSLRERPESLARADYVGFNDIKDDMDLDALSAKITRVTGRRVPVFGIRRSVRFLRPGQREATTCPPEPVAAISAIARPDRFDEILRSSGVRVGLSIRFPDHHDYSGEDLMRVERLIRERNIRYIVTTEKDWTKLRAWEAGEDSVYLARLELSFVGDFPAAEIKDPQDAPADLS
jgi:tetraacyldisaccharide 4'-kinase